MRADATFFRDDGTAARPSDSPGAGASRDRWIGRALLALSLALAGKILGNWLYQLPVLSLLAYTSVTFVVEGVLFGWMGIAAAGAVHASFIWWRDRELSVSSLGAYVLAGVFAWLAMRYVPRLGRGFPGLRSLGWFATAAAAGAVVSSTVITGTSTQVENFWATVAVWSRTTAVTVWVFGPPLLILGVRWLRPWLAAIPGERVAPPPREVRLDWEVAPGAAGHIADVETRAVDVARTVGLSLAMVAAITAGKLFFAGGWGPSVSWWNLLYLAPVFLMAARLRLPGGLLGAGFVGLLSLAGDAVLAPPGGLSEPVVLATYAQLLLFWIVGALLGRAADREGRLLEELADSHQRLRQDLRRVVRALTGALEAKDEYTEGHLRRVTEYAQEVGRRLGLAGRELERLQVASTLHDMGKIAIPESLLNKPTSLTDDELAIMRQHPQIGARLLADIDGLQDVAPLVLHHHERWDGRTDGRHPGYPAGLAGEQIFLGSRIIAVVDTFDAMTTDRPYRRALPVARAKAELVDERGKQFDPAVVDVFLELLDERPWV